MNESTNNQCNTALQPHFSCLPVEDIHCLLVHLPYDQHSQTPCCSDDSNVMYYPLALALARIITRQTSKSCSGSCKIDRSPVTANQSCPRKSEIERCEKTWNSTLPNKVMYCNGIKSCFPYGAINCPKQTTLYVKSIIVNQVHKKT
jgi:hypothetical protein